MSILFVLMALAQEPEENDARFHALLLTAARSHTAYGKVDDVLRFAPTLCMAPPPAPLRFSASKDAGTHGQKLYFLYAWDAASYLKSPRKDHYKRADTAPIHEKKAAEQVLVKQAWSCVKAGEEGAEKSTSPEDRSRFVRREGGLFTTGERKDLFIMVKLDEKVEGTDQGWVYGTVTPDGKSVTSSGRVRSCMACHETAGAGRLFGMSAPAQEPGWVPLFDGKSLEGWEQKNGTATYRVEDGCIVGKTEEGSPNSFLCTKKEYGDFELKFEVKVADELNSGVQIRSASKEDFAKGRVHGPQVEIAVNGTAGFIYAEGLTFGWLSEDRSDPKAQAAFKKGEWNKFLVRAEGKSIKTWVNDVPVANLTDEKTGLLSGFIGLQVHGIKKGTGPWEVRWRNLALRELKK